MSKDIPSAVREICLSFPEAQERVSHGSPDYRVCGKTFATFTVNHHGDGRIALWLRSPPGAQALHTQTEPAHYFVPPYVGHRGWLGVDLDSGLDWRSVAERVRGAYETVAPRTLADAIGATIEIEPPTETVDPARFDPLNRPRGQAVLAALRDICLALPETSETLQFGNPAWRAGKKTFCTVHHRRGRVAVQAWVGADAQSTLTFDERYSIPPYIGSKGWLELDVEDDLNRGELEALIRSSYAHFALKRMLKALAESP